MHSLSGLDGKGFFASSVRLATFSVLLLLPGIRPLGSAYFSGYYTVCGKKVSHEVSTESDVIIQLFLNMLTEYLNKG